MHLENNLKNGTDELIENQEQVIDALKTADHFYICYYSKTNDRIEHRRCFWDKKSKNLGNKQRQVSSNLRCYG